MGYNWITKLESQLLEMPQVNYILKLIWAKISLFNITPFTSREFPHDKLVELGQLLDESNVVK